MVQRMLAFLKTLVQQTLQDRILGLAAEVSFWGVFSLFPALLIAAGVLGTLDGLVGTELAVQAEAQVVRALERLLTDQGQPIVDAVRGLFDANSGGVLTTAALVAAWSVSTGVSTIIDALDIVYEVRKPRSWLTQRLVAMVLGLGSVVVLVVALVMLVVGPLFGGGRALALALGIGDTYGWAWDWLRAPAMVVVLALSVTTLFRFAPRRRTRWKMQLPGAVLSAVLVVAASYLFQVYVGLARDGNDVLGVLGGGLMLMLWLYVVSVVVLLGGEVNAVLTRHIHVQPPEPPSTTP